jgi:hypothetical protein
MLTSPCDYYYVSFPKIFYFKTKFVNVLLVRLDFNFFFLCFSHGNQNYESLLLFA